MFEEIRACILCTAPWMECRYGAQSALHFGNVIIPSCSGVQQGEPLGPLGFSLALQPLVESIKAELQNLNINVLYLDDRTLCGNSANLAAALEIIEYVVALQEVYFSTDPGHFFIFRDQAPLAPTHYRLIFSLLKMVLFFLDAPYWSSIFLPLCTQEKSYECKRSSE